MAQVGVRFAFGLLFLGLIPFQLRRDSRLPSRPWLLLATGGGLILVSAVVRMIDGMIRGIDQPVPSIAEVPGLAGYASLLLSLWAFRIHRSPRRDGEAAIDALMAACATAIAVYALFVSNYYQDASIPIGERTVNGIYSVLVLILVGMVVRIAVGEGARNSAWRLLALGTGAILVNEFAIVLSTIGVSWAVTMGHIAASTAYALGASATLDPGAHKLTATDAVTSSDLTRRKFATLAVSLVVAPIALVLTLIFQFDSVDTRVLAAGAVALPMLALLRMKMLIESNQTVSRLNLGLSESGRTLLECSSISETIRASGSAITTVLGEERDYAVSLKNGDDVHLLASTRPFDDSPVDTNEIDGIATEFASRGLVREEFKVGDRGRLIIASQEALTEPERIATETLSVQLAQALDSAETADRRAAKRFRALVQNASDLVLVVGSDGYVSYMSEASERVLGYPPSAVEGKSPRAFMDEDDADRGEQHITAMLDGVSIEDEIELRILDFGGTPHLFECTFTNMLHVEGVEGIVVNATDVTAKRSLEKDLVSAASVDPLTLLLNRTAFTEEVSTEMRRASITNTLVSVAIINLDGFREINETLGPVLADQVLVSAAHAVRRSVRLSDSVARLSGDEFAVLMADPVSSGEAVATIERVVEELAVPISVGGREFALSASAGVAVESDSSISGVALLRKADTALDTARQRRRGTVLLFEEAMGEEASTRIDIRNRLDHAIRENELRLVYQPITNITTGEIESMEALARWEHPTRGDISPSVFIPIAESTGLIIELGDWALEAACNQLVEWNRNGIDHLTLSVNMSGHQIRATDIIDRVRSILRRTGVDPTAIIIELTESVLIDDTDFIADRISALRSLGLGLAIDDFGTGYSSLSYLQRYEFDLLKIDRSFVKNLNAAKHAKRSEIVRAIVSLAQGLGACTVAEGVETEAERLELIRLGCDRAQGFLFYYPTEADEIPGLVSAAAPAQAA